MAIKLITVRCPQCGSMLNVDKDRKMFYCSYCGAKVILEDDHEYTYRTIDEAKIKQAETDQMVELKKMEMIEKKQAAREKSKKQRIKIALCLAAAGSICLVLGFLLGDASGNPDSGLYMISFVGFFLLLGAVYTAFCSDDSNDDDLDLGDTIKVPSGADDCEGKNYQAIETLFKSAGFSNIACVPLNVNFAGEFH